MRIAISTLTATLCLLTFSSSQAHAETDPGKKALLENQSTYTPPREAVQNRFFLKEERFEFSPIIGFVPNDPMVNRITGGLLVAYHFSESLAAEGAFIYSPDLGETDVKGLTRTLVKIAEQGSANVEFQQPLDKMELGATFAVRWSPVYGKISLVGEGILKAENKEWGMLRKSATGSSHEAQEVVPHLLIFPETECDRVELRVSRCVERTEELIVLVAQHLRLLLDF